MHNWLRQSTEGWSVYYSWMDFIGGLGSVLQMIINAQNEGTWYNPVRDSRAIAI